MTRRILALLITFLGLFAPTMSAAQNPAMDNNIFAAALADSNYITNCLNASDQASVSKDGGSSSSSCVYSKDGTNYGHISDWNTADVTDMGGDGQSGTTVLPANFNQDIKGWETASVTNMANLFSGAANFDQDISDWDVSSVTNMAHMFRDAASFNADLSSWNTASVTDMWAMFNRATSFNADIGDWTTTAVTSMNVMFQSTNFNQDISDWDVSNVRRMNNMFKNNDDFNQDISGWDVSSVQLMQSLFFGASAFDQDIRDWDTGSVTSIGYDLMFNGATKMIARFGTSSTAPVDSFDADGNPSNGYTPSLAFFKQGGVSTLDGFKGVTTTETFTSASTSYSATATAGTLNLGIDLSRPRGTAAVTLSVNGGTATSVTVGAIDSVTGVAALSDFTIASGTNVFDITVTSPNGTSSTSYTLTVTGEGNPAMDNNIFAAAVADSNYITNCLNASDQASVSKDGGSSSSCVYSKDGTNYGHISDWNTSAVTDMGGNGLGPTTVLPANFNQDISDWETASVTNMANLFSGGNATSGIAFSQDISDWDVSSVTNMAHMFRYARNFNADLSRWNTASVTNMWGMFREATSFNADIGGWTTTAVTSTHVMFQGSNFNQDISDWDVSNVRRMNNMFKNNDDFNQDISGWDVSSVQLMQSLFFGASAFDQDIRDWDTGSVTSIGYDLMFNGATKMIARFGTSSTAPVDSFDADGNPSNGYTPSLAFFKQGGVSTLDGFIGVTTTETFTSASTSYTATATAGVLNLSIDLSRPRGTAAVRLSVNGGTATSVTVGAIDPVTGEADLESVNIVSGTNVFTITVTSPNGTSSTPYTLSVTGTAPVVAEAGIEPSDNAITVAEGATTTFTVQLGSAPTSSVTVTPSASDASEVRFVPASLSFTTGDWDTPQTVTVVGVYDAFADGTQTSTLTLTASSTDSDYSGIISTVAVTTTHVATTTPAAMDTDIFNAALADATYRTNCLNEATQGNVKKDAASAHLCVYYDGTTNYGHISDWNTSAVTDMGGNGLAPTTVLPANFNQDISDWETASVTNMANLFSGGNATSGIAFSQDISDWDVSSVTNMAHMFRYARNFNADLSRWNTASVTNMWGMFREATSFNADIGGWTTTAVTSTHVMFQGSNFNQDISDWDVSNVRRMNNMFKNNDDFNQDISGWDVSSVQLMQSLFFGASAFDQDIRDWDTGSVTSIGYDLMFNGATKMIARFGTSSTAPVDSFDADGNPSNGYTPSLAFFKQGGVSTLDGFIGVTTTETFTSASTSYSATATAGTLNLGIDLSRPRGTAAVTLSVNGGTATSVTVGAIDSVTGVAALSDFTIASGTNVFDITVTSPDGTASSTYTLSVTGTAPVVAEAGIEPSDNAITVAEGATTTFTVQLGSAPTSSVTVTPSASDASELRFVPASLSFTTGNWNTPQTVTVVGVYDAFADGTQTSTLTLTASSTDGDYSGIISTVAVTTTHVATTTPAAMDTDIFNAALADATYRTNCLNEATQGNVKKDAASAHLCVYYDGTTNYGHISDWNTSAVTDMSNAFNGRGNFNQNISNWNTANVTNMLGMFQNATNFNQDISGWNTKKVTNMQVMFQFTNEFNQPIGAWDTASVTNFIAMFHTARKFNADISDWKTESATNMSSMFKNAADFDRDIRDWKVDSGDNLSEMFNGATAMIARFGSGGTTPVTSFGNAAGSYAPTSAFFNQGSVSALDGFIGVTTTETFTSASTSYSATATAGTLNLGIDLSRPRGTAAVTLSVNGGTATSVTVGAIDSVTGVAALSDFTIASGTNVFDITVTSPDGTASSTYTLSVTGTAPVVAEAGIEPSDNAITVAEGATTTFTVQLGSAPTSSVTVTPSASDASEVRFSPATLSFTTGDWDTPQTVTVVGVYDAFADGTQTSTLTLTAASTDGNYSGITSTVGVTTTDVAATTPAAMDDTIFDRAVADATYVANCINTATQGNVAKRAASAHHCVYYEGTTNYGHISDWNTASVTDMSNAFNGRSNFNQNITGWDTASVTTFADMFNSASAFNQPIGSWDTDSLQNMSTMFQNATLFNQPLRDWDTTNVTNMFGTFKALGGATVAFNQDISGWDTASVTNFNGMFARNAVFDQDIRDWNVSNSASLNGMFQVQGSGAQAGQSAMRDRFSRTAGYGSAANNYTPSHTFFNQVGVSTLDGFKGVTTTDTFTSASTSYSATATLGTLDLGIDLSRPRGTASVVLTQGGSPSVVTVGAIDPVTGEAALSDFNIAAGSNVFSIIVTSPDASASTTYTLSVTGTAPVVAEAGIEPSANAITVAEGSTTTFTVQLSATPTASVTVTPSAGDASEVRFSPATLSFTTGDWDTPQTVTVAGVFDTITDGTQTSTLTLTAASTDGDYSGITSTVGVTTTDVATTTPAAMDDTIFDRAVTDATYRTNCLNESTQGNVAKGAASAHHCVYYEGTTNYGHISDWNTSAVTDMSNAFNGRSTFDQNISNWNTANVTNMQGMFLDAKEFDQDISSWNTKKVTNMRVMFQFTDEFNQPIGAWDTASVTDFIAMFHTAKKFNADISDWKTESATNMSNMFKNATDFDRDIRDWKVDSGDILNTMFNGATAMIARFGSVTGFDVDAGAAVTPSAAFFNQGDVSVLDGITTVASSSGATSSVALSPGFASNTLSYAGSVSAGNAMALTLDLARPNSTVTVNYGGSTVATSSNVDVDGTLSFAFSNVASGDGNVFTITVTSPDGTSSKTYTLTITGIDVEDTSSKTVVFPLIGQSNMQGRDTFDNGAEYPSGTLQYNQSSTLVAATSPLNHFPENEIPGSMGLALQFTIDYKAANPNHTVVLVPLAVPGTSFRDQENGSPRWGVGEALYNNAVNRINQLFTENPDFELGAFLWHQGEGDRLATSTYIASLTAQIAGMRDEVNVADDTTPYILGGLFETILRAEVAGLIATIPDLVSYTALAPSTGLTDIDDTHFDAASLRTLGSRYYTALGRAADHVVAPSIVTSADSLTVAEGATTTFTVQLGSVPTESVTVTPSASDASEVRFIPASLSFSAGNWSAAQTITVVGVYDAFTDGAQASTLTLTASSTGGDYSGTTSTVGVTTTDTATTTPAAMDNTIFNRAVTDATYVANCLNEAAQANVAKGAASAHLCVYYEGTTNYGHISDWNTSAVTDMGGDGQPSTKVLPANFNQDISRWNTASVTNMANLFSSAAKFDQDISGWDVSSVTNMAHMFRDAASFNADLSGWNTESVTDMWAMFNRATSFNADIGGWTTTAVTSTRVMFQGTNFNQDISGWDVSNVTHMNNMFKDNDDFNQDISSWDVSSVQLMENLFLGASAFDQDIRDWDTGSVGSANYASMFSGASAMIARFGATGTTPVASFGNAAGSYTPTAAFFNQGSVSALDGITAVANSSGATSSVMLSPGFASNTLSYAGSVSAGNAMALTLDLARPNSTVTVNYGGSIVATSSNVDVDGTLSFAFSNVASGDGNVFTITVTSPDGTSSKTYTLTMTGIAVEDTSSRTVVFPLMGQSNMQGRDTFDNGAEYPAGTLQYNQSNALVPASSPLNHFPANQISGSMGLALQFTIDYKLANPNHTVVLVPLAVPGTGFGDAGGAPRWGVGEALYDNAVNHINQLFTENSSFELGAFLWHQGEFDRNATSTYIASLTAQIVGMRDEVTAADETTPYIVGGLFNGSAELSAMTDLIATIPDLVSYTAFAPSTGLSDIDDAQHFDAGSLRTLGSRYYTALGRAEDHVVAPSIVTSAGSLTVAEGATTTFTVQLGSVPTESVTVTPSASDASELRFIPASLSFSAGNWSAAQTVTVVGVFDTLTDGAQVSALTLTASSTDGDYNGTTSTVDVTTTDVATTTVAVMDNTIFNRAVADATYVANCINTATQTNVDKGAASAHHCVYYEGTTNYGHISDWNTSAVTDMSDAFNGRRNFNQDISGWNVSNVDNARRMFLNAEAFDAPLSRWSIFGFSPNGSLSLMFQGTKSFSDNLRGWNVSRVTHMQEMFADSNFNGDISNWNVRFVTTMQGMFKNAVEFNQDIGDWHTPVVRNMESMFQGAVKFDQDISGWDTTDVTKMAAMFQFAREFDQPIITWDVSNVGDMTAMFHGATKFNKPLNQWDVANVTSMFAMFKNAVNFDDGDIRIWRVGNTVNLTGMFDGATNMDARYGSVTGYSATPTAATFFNELDSSVLNGMTVVASSSGVTSSLLFSPSFETYTFDYTGSVSAGNAVALMLDSMNPSSTVTVSYGGSTVATSSDMGADGMLSFAFSDIASGSGNVFTITVTSPGGDASHTYTLTLKGFAVQDTGTKTVVFPLIGQSNMIGRATFDNGAEYPSGTLQYNQSGTLVAAVSPLSHSTSRPDQMGLALQFTIDYKAANPNHRVVLVPFAISGSGFTTSPDGRDRWGVGEALYDNAINHINQLFTDNPTFELGAFLWNQGETDWNATSTYMASLAAQIAGMRDEITAADERTPYIIGGLFDRPLFEAINDVLEDVPNQISYTGFASSDGLSDIDGAHFDAASLRTLGSRYYTAVGRAADNVVDPTIVTRTDSLTVVEGATATFTVALGATPTASVTVTPSASDASEVRFIPASLSFSAENRSVAQTVTVIGVYDTITDGTQTSTLTLTASSTDGDYSGITSTVDVSVTDVATTTVAAMDDTIFARAMADATYVANCLNEATQANVAKGAASAHHCVYYEGATNYGHISDWNTASVTDMSNAFNGRSNFNQDISNWNTASVINMEGMFLTATNFNQDISSWNTKKVTNMQVMFQFADKFNQPIGAWDTASVTDFGAMFHTAKKFNADISDWKTPSATNMSSMFEDAADFEQDIRDWKVDSGDNLSEMFNGATAMIARFGSVTGFDVDAGAAVTPSAAFFNQGDVSVLDGITTVASSSGATSSVALSPGFASNTLSYAGSVSAGNAMALTLDLARPNSTVTVNYGGSIVATSSNVDVDGTLSFAFSNVASGDGNVFTITVTSPSGATSSVYTLTITGIDVEDTSTKTVVFPLIGQSNMQGRDTFDNGAEYPSGTLQYNQSSTLVVATSPLNHFPENEIPGSMGLALQFTIDYKAANPNHTVVLVPLAVPGTSFRDQENGSPRWGVGEALYNNAVNRINQLFTENPDFELGAFLWHQGEGDWPATSTYIASLTAQISGMRDEVTAADETTPYILGGLSSDSSIFDDVAGLIATIPDLVSYTAFAPSTGLTTVDNVHFDAASLRTLGSRYYTALGRAADHVVAPSIVTSADSLTVAEGATTTFTVQLGSVPTESVTVTPSASDASEVRFIPASLSFSAGNWSAAQTVTVVGVYDTLTDGAQASTLTLTASSTGGDYSGTTSTVGVTTTDTATTTPAAMDNTIFNRAVTDATYVANCLNEAAQANVAKGAASAHLCVYYEGTTNYGHISDWNTSAVTDMGGDGQPSTKVLPANFNQDISGWNTASVTNMASLFSSAAKFDQDISGWDVSSVTNMAHMFRDAASFNADLSDWNTESVTDMWAMFNRATSFNADIGGWTTTAVTSTRVMFQGTNFNQDISGWDVSNVTHMNNMFKDNDDFNQDISSWDVSSVQLMQNLFLWGKCL